MPHSVMVRGFESAVKRWAAVLVVVAAVQISWAGASAFAATNRPLRMSAMNGVAFNRINAIRNSFGLQAGRITTAYDSEVLQAIRFNEDPPFAPAGAGVVGEESLWGVLPGSTAVTSSAGDVVNAWVYHDGWEGSVGATWNADCTSAAAPGCNGHRRALLSQPPVPGATLTIDVVTRSVTFAGAPALALAALMVWHRPTSKG